LGEGWAVGRFPGQFLRRTELIKRSLRLDDEPKWWCREPLQCARSEGLINCFCIPLIDAETIVHFYMTIGDVQSFHKKPSTPAGSIVPSTSHMCLFCDAPLSILDRRSGHSLTRDKSTIPGDAQRSRGTFS